MHDFCVYRLQLTARMHVVIGSQHVGNQITLNFMKLFSFLLSIINVIELNHFHENVLEMGVILRVWELPVELPRSTTQSTSSLLSTAYWFYNQIFTTFHQTPEMKTWNFAVIHRNLATAWRALNPVISVTIGNSYRIDASQAYSFVECRPIIEFVDGEWPNQMH